MAHAQNVGSKKGGKDDSASHVACQRCCSKHIVCQEEELTKKTWVLPSATMPQGVGKPSSDGVLVEGEWTTCNRAHLQASPVVDFEPIGLDWPRL